MIDRSLQLRILLLLALITMINYFDRSAIAYAIVPIKKELHLNDQQFGIIASAFSLGYLAMMFVGGILVDRFGSIYTWAIAAVVWSIVTILIGLTKDFFSFLFLRVCLGLAEGIHFPALVKTVSDWLPANIRAKSMAIGLLGVPLSSVIGAPFMTFLMLTFGWREMFAVLGFLGVFWAALWLILFRGKKAPLPPKTTYKPSWKVFLFSRPFLINCFVYFIFGYILFFGFIWLPGFIERMYGITLQKTSVLVMVMWIVISIFTWGGGWISDFLKRKYSSIRVARVYPIMVGMTLSAICFFLFLLLNQFVAHLILMTLGLGFAFLVNAPIYSLSTDLFPNHEGKAQGIAGCFFALSGIVSPALTGYLVQISGNFQVAIFFVSFLSLTASLLSLIFLHPDLKR